MRFGLAVILVLMSSTLLYACGPDGDTTETSNTEPPVRTVEVTTEVTVEKVVTVRVGGTDGDGGTTRAEPPAPTLPDDTDIKRTVGETATLDNGNSVTVFSGERGIPPEDFVYEARAGMEFFIVEAEVCGSETGAEPSYFTPREFSLLNANAVRRMASVPTRLPALRGSSVDPGACNRGYITFQVEEGKEPEAVVYEGSEAVEWELSEG
ncbi:hypothetical protein BH23ACT11_BH23ACT11_29300 [soil metagenome]